ncbi:hypothetical protein VE03_06545 [Pseudogymnoascus sp. 23342-1-I1]|nr:hypothetical protein VE03_06545 [Pseudogymnoascus sp. 23342-1-I1]
MAILFAPTTVPIGDWHGVFQQPKPAPPPPPPSSSPHPSDAADTTSLTRVDSSHSGGSRSEKRQSHSLRNMFSKSAKNKTYSPPPIPEIGAAADRLPYNDGPRHRVELTPTELSDDISISRTNSTNGGSSISSAASFIDSPTGAHPPQMTEKLARVFGTKVEQPSTRKRDSFLAAMPKRSLERPPTSAGPPVISTPFAAAPPPAKWEPPPFFKGLSGAVQHASLMTCGVTANAIIYLSTHDKSGKNVAVLGFGSDPVKAEKAKEKHRLRVVDTLGKAEWNRKIFVLTSAGYILQFSCDGAFNRLPEQSIRLSRHSIAFVSDVIPGRHWVIQITTVYDGLSAITPPELSATPAPPAQQRPGSKSTYVRPIKQFLLIMDSGEDLDAWLTAVRHEIDVLGGKAATETSANAHAELSRSPLSETTNAFPAYSPHPVDEEEDEEDNNDPLPWETDERTANLPPWPADNPTPRATNTNTLSSVPSTRSIEEHLLDSLRDSNTYSHPRSSGGRTFFTSPNSSPPRSPVYDSFPPALSGGEEDEGRFGFGEFGHQQQQQYQQQQQRPNAANIRERRKSAQGARPPVLDTIIASATTPPLPTTDTPLSPSTDLTPPRRPARRTPPTALKTRRLSIVEDQPSPALLSDELMDEIGKPMVSPKSRARRHHHHQLEIGGMAMGGPMAGPVQVPVPVLPMKSGRRTSSLPSARGVEVPAAEKAGSEVGSERLEEGEAESEDEFQFHHWTSRLSPPPPRAGTASPSFPPTTTTTITADFSHTSDFTPSSPPPPLPLFSYPFPPSSSSQEDDANLSPRPLVIAPHTARANAKAQAARDKRVSINGAPGGLARERRVSVSSRGGAGEGGKRMSIARSGSGASGGGEGGKRDSIVVLRERRVPPKPLGSRGFIALTGEAEGGYNAGYNGPSSAPGAYGGYGTYGGVAGGVSTGRVVKAGERMVIRERGASLSTNNNAAERSPTVVKFPVPPRLRSPPPAGQSPTFSIFPSTSTTTPSSIISTVQSTVPYSSLPHNPLPHSAATTTTARPKSRKGAPAAAANGNSGGGSSGGAFGLGLDGLAVGLGGVGEGGSGGEMERAREVAGRRVEAAIAEAAAAGAKGKGGKKAGKGKGEAPKVVEMVAMGGVKPVEAVQEAPKTAGVQQAMGVQAMGGQGVRVEAMGPPLSPPPMRVEAMGPPLSPPPMRALPPLAPPPTRGLPPVPPAGGRARGMSSAGR